MESPREQLFEDVRLIAIAVAELRPEDSATLVSAIDETPIEKRIRLSSEEIAALLTEETTITQAPMNLLVKKPDYLGFSKWEFKHGDRPLEASIKDYEWLRRFQSGEIVLRAGDALRAIVKSEVARGFEGNIVETRHEIVTVLDVVPVAGGDQRELS